MISIQFLTFWQYLIDRNVEVMTLSSLNAIAPEFNATPLLSARINTPDGDFIYANQTVAPTSLSTHQGYGLGGVIDVGIGIPSSGGYEYYKNNNVPINEFLFNQSCDLGYRVQNDGIQDYSVNGWTQFVFYGKYKFTIGVEYSQSIGSYIVKLIAEGVSGYDYYVLPPSYNDAYFAAGGTVHLDTRVGTFNDGFSIAIDFTGSDWSFHQNIIPLLVSNVSVDKTSNTFSAAIYGTPIDINGKGTRVANGSELTSLEAPVIQLNNAVKLVRDNTTVMVTPPVTGSAGTPDIPGYYKTVLVDVFHPPVSLSSLLGLIPSGGGSYHLTNAQLYGYTTTEYQTVWVPGIPGTPSTLSIRPSYVLGQAWNGAARSIESVSGDVGYEFRVPSGVVGVVTGLNDANTGFGYQEIDYAFHFSNGAFTVMLSGVQATAPVSYNWYDWFYVLRVANTVKFMHNSTTVYSMTVQSTPALFADASMYSSGDSIDHAAFMDPQSISFHFGPTPASVSTPLKAATSSSGDYEFSYVNSTIPPMSSISYGENKAESLANMSIMGSVSADYDYSYSNVSILPLLSDSYSGFETPSVAYAGGTINFMSSISTMSQLVSMDSSSSLSSHTSVSSDYDYNYSSASLATAVSSDSIFVRSFAGITINRPSIKAFGTTGVNTYAPISIQRPSVKASGAGQARFAIALPKVASSGQSGSIGQARIRVRATVKAYGTTEAIGGARIRVGVNLKAKAYGAGLSKVSISKPSVSSIGITGSIGNARISISSPIVNANGTSIKGGVARISVSVPYIVPAMKARVFINKPSLVAHGTTLLDWNIINGAPVKATRYAAYAINLRHRSGGDTEQGYLGEVSTYDNYRYNSIVRLGNKYYGSSEDGLFLLEGENDDGVPIKCSMKTATTDLGAIQFKTPKNMYIAGRINGGFDYQVIVGEDDPITHSMPTTVTNKPWSSRVPFASGLRSRYYGFGVSTSDSKAEIESLNLEVFIHERA